MNAGRNSLLVIGLLIVAFYLWMTSQSTTRGLVKTPAKAKPKSCSKSSLGSLLGGLLKPKKAQLGEIGRRIGRRIRIRIRNGWWKKNRATKLPASAAAVRTTRMPARMPTEMRSTKSVTALWSIRMVRRQLAAISPATVALAPERCAILRSAILSASPLRNLARIQGHREVASPPAAFVPCAAAAAAADNSCGFVGGGGGGGADFCAYSGGGVSPYEIGRGRHNTL